MWISGLIAAGLTGMAMLWLGWRGRRVDRHPCCRRCGYDLSGTPDVAACLECGRALTRRRAVRRGRRRRRPAVMTIGAMLLTATIGGGGYQAQLALRGFDWNTIKPDWLLVMNARGGRSAKAEAARAELVRRLDHGRLSGDLVRELATEALALQADPDANWSGRWGEFVELAWYHGHVDDAAIHTYLETTLVSGLTVNGSRRARSGGTLEVLLKVASPRGAANGSLFEASCRLESVEIGDRFAGITSADRWRWSLVPGAWQQGAAVLTADASAFAEPGTYDLSARWILFFTCRPGLPPRAEAGGTTPIAMSPGWRSGGGRGDHRPAAPPPDAVLVVPVEMVQPVTLVGPDEPLLELVRDDTLITSIRDSIEVTVNSVLPLRPDGTNVWLEVVVDDPPLPVSFRVVPNLQATRGFKTPPLTGRPGLTKKHQVHVCADEAEVETGTMRLVLETDPVGLESTPGIERVWDGSIEIEIPLARDAPPAAVAEAPEASATDEADEAGAADAPTAADTAAPPGGRRPGRNPAALRAQAPAGTATLEQLLVAAGLRDGKTDPEIALAAPEALSALGLRVSTGRLRDPEGSLAEAVLARQADTNGPWDPRWGDLLVRLFERGDLSLARLERYVRQALMDGPVLTVRPTIRRHQWIPFKVDLPPLRAGDRRLSSVTLDLRVTGASIDGEEVRDLDRGRTLHLNLSTATPARDGRSRSRRAATRPIDVRGSLRHALEDGHHEVVCQVEVRGRVRRALLPEDAEPAEDVAGDSYVPAFRWTSDLAGLVEIVGDDREIVDLDRREETTRAVRDAVRSATLDIEIPAQPDQPISYAYNLALGPRPAALACTVLVRTGGQEHEIGTITIPAGTDEINLSHRNSLPGFDTSARTVTLVLRPEPSLAESWADMLVICGQEIELADVPVRYSRRAMP